VRLYYVIVFVKQLVAPLVVCLIPSQCPSVAETCWRYVFIYNKTNRCTNFPFFFSWRDSPLVGLGLLIHEVCFSRSHTTTHHNRYKQHSQHTNIHAPGGIRTYDLSRRAAVDLRLRPRGHWDRQFSKFILVKKWNSTCFRQFLCPSSGVHSLYTWHWYMSYGFVDSFRAGPGSIPLLSVQWMNSWWWADELLGTCRCSYFSQNKFGKLVHLLVLL
jgi:hypothetical protein